MEVVQTVIEIERGSVTLRAAALVKEDLLAANLGLTRPGPVKPARVGMKLRRGREIEHVLHLRHVADLDTVDDVHTFFCRVHFISVEISGPLLEFREILNRAQAAFGAMDLLIENTAEASGIQTEAPLLRPHVRCEVELPGGVSIDVTIEAGHAQAGIAGLPVVGRIELFLREGGEQHAEAIE